MLGPLQVTRSGAPQRLGGRQQRAVLALLLLDPDTVVSTDRLVDVLWGERPPKGSIGTLHTYISRLRDLLETHRPRSGASRVLLTEPTGYQLRVDSSSIDAAVFEQRARSGRAMLEAGRFADASAELAAALAVWRGPVLADLTDYEFVGLAATKLEELRLGAIEARLEADLALGRHAELVAELDQLVAAHPVRERLHGQRMLALYRCGRQADALAGYQRLRESLADELGIDPGPALQELHRRILRQDPVLGLEAGEPRALPVPPNALLGRERELAEVRELLRRDEVRLLVLTGAGGSGKTRLALEAARQAADLFENGAVFVALAPLRDPDLVIGAIAQAVGVQLASGEQLAAALGTWEMLLVLDNLEHLRAAGPSLVELLARAPRLTLLVTSRVVLRLSGEHVYPVEPLADDAATALFVERAREAEPRFRPNPSDAQAIRAICRRLDGLPLAIELAASRIRMLTPAELLVRLEPRLPLLTDGAHDLPVRQRTLRATIEWSFELLDKDERRDLCRLAVFAGGCTLQAAEAVCGVTLERLGAFVDHSLLRRTVGENGSRYHMLETIREHAADQLGADEAADDVCRRHAEHFLALAESANLEDGEAAGEQHHEIVTADQDNLRAALQWTLATGEIELGLRLAIALENYWATSAPFEGTRWFEALLPLAEHVPARLHARAVRCYAGATTMTGADLSGERLHEQSLAEFRALGDEAAVGSLLHRLAESAHQRGDRAHARRLAEESLQLARRSGNSRVEAQSLGTLGKVSYADGEHELGMKLLERSANMCGEVGFKWGQGITFAELCENALELGRTREAEAWGGEALRLLHQIGDRQNTLCLLASLARAAAETGRAEQAGRLWGAIEAEEVRAPTGWWELQREQYAAPVLVHQNTEFERGRLAGRALSLDEAVRCALGDQAGPSQTVTSPAAPRATT